MYTVEPPVQEKFLLPDNPMIVASPAVGDNTVIPDSQEEDFIDLSDGEDEPVSSHVCEETYEAIR
jgi:hypothetical protein